MPPRAPTVWTSAPTRSERVIRRLDERHAELSRDAKAMARRYRGARTGRSVAHARQIRSDFLAALGRLSAFEDASQRLMSCRYQVQLSAYADGLSRDYFELWQIVARRGAEAPAKSEAAAERLDRFAVQIGRLEGMADALSIAGRSVRLLPVPHLSWSPADLSV